jgi:hypothetical protein
LKGSFGPGDAEELVAHYRHIEHVAPAEGATARGGRREKGEGRKEKGEGRREKGGEKKEERRKKGTRPMSARVWERRRRGGG